MSPCNCAIPPAQLLSRLRPPPDPSLVWHLISDEPFVPAPQCDFAASALSATNPALIIVLVGVFLVVCLVGVVCAVCIVRSRHSKKAISSERIIDDHNYLPSYNSMKYPTGHHNAMSGSMYGSGVLHGVATPASIRQYGVAAHPIRHTSSAQLIRQPTLRYEHPAIASPFQTLGRHYEEIGPGGYGGQLTMMTRGGLPYVMTCGREGVSYTLGANAGRPPVPPSRQSFDLSSPALRHSVRKPPPTCRPPPPPPPGSGGSSRGSGSEGMSPRSTSSGSSSFEHELHVLRDAQQDSPPYLRSGPPLPHHTSSHLHCDDEPRGRESGYGTAPSRQWRSPQGSDDQQPAPPTQNMTYV